MQDALHRALQSAGLTLGQLDGLIAVPSLAEPRFMEAHYIGMFIIFHVFALVRLTPLHVATKTGLLPHKNVLVRTIDTGGAGPISALLEAREMVIHEGCDLVAIVAGDAVSSLDTKDFLQRADMGCADPDNPVKSPVIPNSYDRVAQWQMEKYNGTTHVISS